MPRPAGVIVALALVIGCVGPSGPPRLDPVDAFLTNTVQGSLGGLISGAPAGQVLVDSVGDIFNTPFPRADGSVSYGATDRGWTQIRIHRIAIDSPTGISALASCPAALRISLVVSAPTGSRSTVIHDRAGACDPFSLLPTPVVLLSEVDASGVLGTPSFQTSIYLQATLDPAWPTECTAPDRADCGTFGDIGFRITTRYDYTIR